jgi:glyoxylase-like metal-dependent hydrolase (beta-lactamase superfamily II)
MASARVDIISIGTLGRNRLWNESQAVRTAHATTSLIRTPDGRHILVDPGLPAVVLKARIGERVGLAPETIDTVFLTNFRPAHRAGLGLFDSVKVLMHENEIDFARRNLDGLIGQSSSEDHDHSLLEADMKLLDMIRPAPDQLAAAVDLFPLFGYTPGTCGLLVSAPMMTLLIAGDAVPTLDHFLGGQVLPDSDDISAAQESMREVYEIADLIVPGHDNLFLNPRAQGM